MSQYRQKEIDAIKASEGLSHPIFDGDRKKIKDLQRQLKKKSTQLRFMCDAHLDLIQVNEDDEKEINNLQRQLAEAREENGTLINKNILLAEGNSILMQQLKEKGE